MIVFFQSVGTIIWNNILPIAIIIAAGYFMERKFEFNLRILSKLNFYILIPCFMFINLYEMEFDSSFFSLIIAEVIFMILANLISGFYAKRRGYEGSRKNHFQNAVVFHNMGNIGVPLITLLFSGEQYLVDGEPVYLSIAISAQLILMTTQNLGMNSWGFYKGFAAKENSVRDSIRRILGIPILYTVLLVILFRLLPIQITDSPIYVSMEYIKGALIPIALLALGMQVGKTGFNFKKVKNYEVVVLKLIVSFVLALGINILFGFTGVFARVMMIASMTPIAINVAMVSIEARSEEEFTSQTVVLSTVLALLVLPFVLYVTQILYPI